MGKRTRRFPDRAGKTGNPEYLHRVLPFLSYHKELPIYLFLQRIFYDPGPDRICASIQKNADFSFNLTDIFQKLCYGRILEPRSKTLLQQPDSDVLQMYRAPDVLCENFDDIQSEFYRNTLKLGERKTGVIY